ncbi:MAG: PcfJ domain-containing protein [Acutalibacteraceae bacterium]
MNETLSKSLPYTYAYETIDFNDSAFKCASKYLGNKVNDYYSDDTLKSYVTGVTACCEAFCKEIRKRKREIAFDSRYQLQIIRHNLFKKNKRHDLSEHIDKIKPFGNEYIFFSNLDKKKKRKGVCSHCHSSFEVPATAKHNEKTICPSCGHKVIYCAERYSNSKHDKIKMLYIDFVDNYMTYELDEIERRFVGTDAVYSGGPLKRTITYLDSGKKLSCSLFPKPYFGWDWTYFKMWSIRDEAFIYCTDYKRLQQVLSIKHIDFQKMAESSYFGNFETLIQNLKKYPVTEYLCKTRLTRIASSEFYGILNTDGHDFKSVFGISKQMYAMYRDERVSLREHSTIKRVNEVVTVQWLSLLRAIINSPFTSYSDLNIVLKYISVEKLNNYLEKQTSKNKLSKGYILNKLADFYSMSEALNIPITKKNATPKKLIEYHDHLMKQFEYAEAEKTDKLTKEKMQRVNAFFPGYSKSGFTALLPQVRSDFIIEGQMLSHCVGQDRYFKNHVSGESMIFFIRRADDPDTPFYTAEINMSTYNIIQLYGFKDCKPTKEVRSFTEHLARFISKIHKCEVQQAS